jgi:glycosyltransferase involved in cell wall biosynthesis
VEIPAVRPQRRRTSLRVGILGRIAPWKGQDVFLRAFGQAFPNGSETAYVIGAPMFGAAEEAYARNLKTLVFDLGLGDRVSFTGFVDDVTCALADVDVLVHASVLPEPFGQVVAEGMAAGIPVIAAAAGGPAEMIEDGIDGLLYPPGDVGALASALRKLVNDPALCQRISVAASQRAQEFSPARVAERVMDVYASILPA